jgi:hypothetical protein
MLVRGRDESGRVRRIRRQEFLGTLEDFATKKLAMRELDISIFSVLAKSSQS